MLFNSFRISNCQKISVWVSFMSSHQFSIFYIVFVSLSQALLNILHYLSVICMQFHYLCTGVYTCMTILPIHARTIYTSWRRRQTQHVCNLNFELSIGLFLFVFGFIFTSSLATLIGWFLMNLLVSNQRYKYLNHTDMRFLLVAHFSF